MFKRNEGIFDRIVRVVLGMGLLSTSLFRLGGLKSGVRGVLAAGLGATALITGFTGVSLLYTCLGISTLEKEKALLAECASMAAHCRPGQSSAGQTCESGPQSCGETRCQPA